MEYEKVFKGRIQEMRDFLWTVPTIRDLDKDNLISYSEYVLYTLQEKIEKILSSENLSPRETRAYSDILGGIQSVRTYYMKKWTINNCYIHSIEGLSGDTIYGLVIRIYGSKGAFFVTGRDLFDFYKESPDDQVFRYRVPFLKRIPRLFTTKLDIIPLCHYMVFPEVGIREMVNRSDVPKFRDRKDDDRVDPRYWNIIKGPNGEPIKTHPRREEFKINYKLRSDNPKWANIPYDRVRKDSNIGSLMMSDVDDEYLKGNTFDPYNSGITEMRWLCVEPSPKINMTIDGKVIPKPPEAPKDGPIRSFFKKLF